MTADLHIHTTASDGRLSPNKILQQAIEVGLSYIAITDHDTVDGLLEILEIIEKNFIDDISIIPGIELSTEFPENEVHILGYQIDIYNLELRNQLNLLVTHRHERIKQMIYKLNQLGYAIDYLRVLEIAKQSTSIGRPHLAMALIEKGYFSNVSDVFTTLLNKSAPAYVPHYKLTPVQAITLIKKVGGIPVLAHPGLIGNDNIVLDLINTGILGLEVFHPTHNELQIQKYLDMTNQYQLLITGGSDFHAVPTRFPEKLGIFTIPISLAEKLNNNFNVKKIQR
jgi:predicted metal-dependent phosphoesterase TrpH